MFCVNSLTHWLGETPFDDKYTPVTTSSSLPQLLLFVSCIIVLAYVLYPI